MQRVLMIDDDTELCEMVAEYLAPEGFEVEAVHNGQEGVERARAQSFDLLLLDVMLPQLNGFEVLRRLRGGDSSTTTLPVIMLTARGDAIDRIIGLEIGADDYLPKPFEERELVARMRAILRRSNHRAANSQEVSSTQNAAPARKMVRIGDLMMDAGSRTVQRGEELVILTAVEFDLLWLLLQAAGNVVEREQMAQDVLDRKLLPFDRSIDTHIGHIRRKLSTHPDGSERIKTVRGVGYIYTLPSQ